MKPIFVLTLEKVWNFGVEGEEVSPSIQGVFSSERLALNHLQTVGPEDYDRWHIQEFNLDGAHVCPDGLVTSRGTK